MFISWIGTSLTTKGKTQRNCIELSCTEVTHFIWNKVTCLQSASHLRYICLPCSAESNERVIGLNSTAQILFIESRDAVWIKWGKAPLAFHSCILLLGNMQYRAEQEAFRSLNPSPVRSH